VTDPDSLVRTWASLCESGDLHGFDPVAQRGLVHAIRCDKCRSRIRHRTRGGDYRCGKCGVPWPSEERLTLRGAVDCSKRPGGAELRIARRLDLGVTIGAFWRARDWRWHARAYFAAVLLQDEHGRTMSIRSLTLRLADHFPRAPFAWRRDRVRGMVEEGRAELARRFACGVGRRAAA
jgi:hypothetical protein